MSKRKILTTSALSTLFLLLVGYFSLRLSSRLNPEMFNLAMCFLAGFSVALIALLFAMNAKHIEKINDYKAKSFYITILSAISIIFLWKLLENFSGNVPAELLSGLVGGFVAHFYFTKTNKSKQVIHYHDFYFSKTVKQ